MAIIKFNYDSKLIKNIIPRENWKDSNVVLFDLQEKYLKSRSKKDWDNLFNKIIEVMRRVIIHKYLASGFAPSENQIEDKTLESTIEFMNHYKNPDFKIEKTFVTYLMFSCLRPLYSPKIIEMEKMDQKTIIDTEKVEKKVNKLKFENFENEMINSMESGKLAGVKIPVSLSDLDFIQRLSKKNGIAPKDILHYSIVLLDIMLKQNKVTLSKKLGLKIHK